MFLKFILISLIVLIAILSLPRLVIWNFSHSKLVFEIEKIANTPTAIVFGAGLLRNGRPTAVLKDRITAATKLYQSGKIQTILMSGGDSHSDYFEPIAMRQYALELGIPAGAIILDNAGRRTYDSCYRAKYIYGIEQAVLVTQRFHLPRAIYICEKLGIESIGFPSDFRNYRRFSSIIWNAREFPANLRALLDVHLIHPRPLNLDKDYPSSLEAQ